MADGAAPGTPRLPLTNAPTLRSDWHSVAFNPDTRRSLGPLGAGPDDGLWTGANDIRRYSFETQTFELMFDIPNITIAPTGPSTCWAVTFEKDTTFVVRASKGEETRRMPPLPGVDEFPFVITAGRDDAVWVQAIGKRCYALLPDHSGWTEIALDGIEPVSLSVGAPGEAWLVGRKAGCTALWRHDSKGGGWVASVENLPPDHEYRVAACADGGAWLVSKKGGASTLFLFANGAWLPVGEIAGTTLDFYGMVAAGTSTRLFAADSGLGPKQEVLAFSVGVVDRPPRPWPGDSADERAAYTYISRQLGIIGAAGIRGEYTNRNQPFDSWRVDIHRMDRPRDIGETGWNAMVEQLLDELESAIAVNNLFRNLADLNTKIGIVNATVLPGVERQVGLSHQSAADERQWVDLMIGGMFRAALGAVSGRLPPPYNAIAAIVASGVFAAIGARTGGDGSDPNAMLKLRFAELTREAAELFLRSHESNERDQKRILSDWASLDAAGRAVRSGLWAWPSEETMEIARPAAAAFELYFYKSLMPVKWQVVWWKNWWINNTPYPPYPIRIKAPGHAGLWECKGDPREHMICDTWVCNARGAATDAAGSLEPFPGESLMKYLADTLKQDRAALFKGGAGWALPQVEGKPPTSRAGWEPQPSGQRLGSGEAAPAAPEGIRAGAEITRFIASRGQAGGG